MEKLNWQLTSAKGTPWEELNTHCAGWWIEVGSQSLVKTIEIDMCLYDKSRKQMGLNGRKLIKESYSIQSVASKTIKLYKWVLEKKERPVFVDIK